MTDPRWLDRDALARHICESPSAINRMVKEGRIPQPTYRLGPRKPRWDRDAVDAALAGAVASRPKGAAHLAAAILEEARR